MEWCLEVSSHHPKSLVILDSWLTTPLHTGIITSWEPDCFWSHKDISRANSQNQSWDLSTWLDQDQDHRSWQLSCPSLLCLLDYHFGTMVGTPEPGLLPQNSSNNMNQARPVRTSLGLLQKRSFTPAAFAKWQPSLSSRDGVGLIWKLGNRAQEQVPDMLFEHLDAPESRDV